jgi:hypothetical protein
MKNIEKYENFINEGWFTDAISKFTQGWKSLWGTTGISLSKAAKAKAKANPNFSKEDYWTLITIIACENYSTEKQGMSDTAQSIYNRFNVPGKPYGKTIKEIILSKNQYEPVTRGKAKGAKWDNIQSMKDAINVYSKTKGVDVKKATEAIVTATQAQKDSTLSSNAGRHVQSRTEFLASPPSSGGAVKPVERPAKEKHNSFFWNYAGKKNFYAKKDLSPKSKPQSVNIT